jgi:tetraacyldisaccharide 4'-kinase
MEVIGRLGHHVFILDDGFQHRRLYRNLDLVCIDADEPIESLRLLPNGRLREPLASLNRAGALIWTRWQEGQPSDRLASGVLRVLTGELPVFRSVSAIAGFQPVAGSGGALPARGLEGQAIGALAAIARPERLKEDLEAAGARVVWFCAKRDHYHWQPEEVTELLEKARLQGARAVVTTGKDAVKMMTMEKFPVPLYRSVLATRILEWEAFESLLDSVPAPDRASDA